MILNEGSRWAAAQAPLGIQAKPESSEDRIWREHLERTLEEVGGREGGREGLREGGRGREGGGMLGAPSRGAGAQPCSRLLFPS